MSTQIIRIPKGRTLFPFQVDTVARTIRFLQTTEGRACYVANEMGLGKSVTAIVTASSLCCARVLIIAPTNMLLVWEEEIHKWANFSTPETPRQPPNIATVLISKDVLTTPRANWVICSYGLTIRTDVLKNLQAQQFDLLILDEAHYIKNYKAKRTSAVTQNLWPRATYRLLLSGTPFTRNIVDCFVPFSMILPSQFPSFYEFTERYSYKRITQWGTNYYGLKNPEELKAIIRNNFYIRYRKEEVLTELPPKVYQKIILPPEYSIKVQSKEQAELEKEKLSILEQLTQGKPAFVPKTMAEHRRLQGEAKVVPITDFVANILDQEEPVVLFAHHRGVISAYADALKKYNPLCITGDTPAIDRKAYVDQFQEGKTKLIICNFVAGGVGVTLTRSRTVVLAELDWVASTIMQAIDRVHRIGAKSQVTIYWFMAKSSLDGEIDRVVMQRIHEFKDVLH